MTDHKPTSINVELRLPYPTVAAGIHTVDPQNNTPPAMSPGKNLPQEIIEAILRRLPAKSLGRFKSVSKPWRSLISNPKFIKTHKKTSKLILISDIKSLFSVNINELPPYLNTDDLCVTGKELTFRPPSIRWEQILGSCNGFVLAKDEDDTIFLMNPTTREVSKLPVNPFALPFRDSFALFSVNINELPPYLNTDDLCVTGKELTFRPPAIRWKQILGSCNGLVLAKDEDDTIFLMNPTTREVSKLPVNPFALPFRDSFVMYGFGYDSSTDDYKLVSISFWDTDNEHNPDCTDMFISIYSLRKNSWKKVNNSPYDHAVGHFVNGVLINEKLHWLTKRIPSYSSTIVAFSLANEEFKEIELPDSIDNEKAVFNELVVLGGKLAIFGNQVGNDLWVMEEYDYGESWIRVFIDGIEIDPVKPLCSVDGSDRDIVFGDEDGVVVYNLDEKRCRNVRVLGGPNGFTIEGTYLESLVSPKSSSQEHYE